MEQENEQQESIQKENRQKAVIDYWIKQGYDCDVFIGDKIPVQQLAVHRKFYAPMAENERVLLLVGTIKTSFDMGLCITDRFVYYKLMPDAFFAPFRKKRKGIVPLENEKDSFQVFEAYLHAIQSKKRWLWICAVLLALFICFLGVIFSDNKGIRLILVAIMVLMYNLSKRKTRLILVAIMLVLFAVSLIFS